MNEPATHRDLQALRDLFESNRKSDKEAIALALTSAEKAVDKANEANEKRLDGLNELRSMAQDQANSYLRRDVYDTQHRALGDKVDILAERVSGIEGRFLAIGIVGTLFGIGGVILALLK